MPRIKNIICVLILFLGLASRVSAQISLPPRIFGDTIHAPFYHGVASGDPLPNAVIIWTRITPLPSDFAPLAVNYEVCSDSLFSSIIVSGSLATDSSSDWTIKKDIIGLTANSIYYYRFNDGSGNYSVIGRTRTAPTGTVNDLKFAIFSCSSIYSGFFNAYARIAEHADSLHAAIHVGDYIYNSVDPQEQVRVPNPFPVDPANLEEWRDRHEYYLLDPDLRSAKAALPWILLWDNHDQDCGGGYTCSYGGGNRAFMEWLPIRELDTLNPINMYRTYSYGDLADIIVADALMFRHTDTLTNGEYNMLGNFQFQWLTQQLQASTAKWKLLAEQRMMGGWYTGGIAPWLLAILPNDGPVFDNGSWDGFPETRHLLFDFLRTNLIDNTIVLSGDAHVSIAQDLVENPNDTASYNPLTGVGSAGVEFLPSSITRGNMDEAGAPISAFGLINNVDRQANPQHQFTDFFNHGYGILHLMPDSSIAQFWYTPKLQISTQDSLGATLVVKDAENHWSRSSGYSNIETSINLDFRVYPNPANDLLLIQLTENHLGNVSIEIIDAVGEVHLMQNISLSNLVNTFMFNIASLRAGLYFIRIDHHLAKKFIKL